jgi:hypothetical protein
VIDWILAIWHMFYAWASAQPVFIQVALGIALFIGAIFILMGLLAVVLLVFTFIFKDSCR